MTYDQLPKSGWVRGWYKHYTIIRMLIDTIDKFRGGISLSLLIPKNKVMLDSCVLSMCNF